jgi:hypothetical protein
MRFWLALASLLLSIPPLCGAVLFWAMVVWNTMVQGAIVLQTLEWYLWLAGVGATVVGLLFLFTGFTLLYAKSDGPA